MTEEEEKSLIASFFILMMQVTVLVSTFMQKRLVPRASIRNFENERRSVIHRFYLDSPMAPRTSLDDIDDEGNIEFGTGGSNCYTEEDVPVADPSPTTKRAKKSKLTDIQEIKQVFVDMVGASNRIVDAFTTINYGELYEALHALPNLSEQQFFAAYKYFSTDKEAAKAFLGCPDNALKFGLVHLYLYGTFSPPPAEPTTFSSATNEVDE